MITPRVSFLSLTANDLVTRRVVTLPQTLSLRSAAQMLQREQISGAPVVDDVGRCVGVLSASDFMRWAEKGAPTETINCTVEPWVSDWQVIDLEVVPSDEVRRHMSTDVVTAPPNTPITHLARKMIDAHIHRIIVADEDRRPVGIISSTDILAAVAAAEWLGQPIGDREPIPVHS